MTRNKQTCAAAPLVLGFAVVSAIAPSYSPNDAIAQTTQPDTQPSTQPDTPGHWPSETERLARTIELAHGADKWNDVEALECAIKVEFNGKQIINGQMLFEPHAGRVRIEMDDDDETTLIYDGHTAWISPANSGFDKPRFHVRTWAYFLAAPFKLRDPGVNLSEHNLRTVANKLCPSMKMTFEPGTGDSPDDWYIVYADPANSRLHAMAYIVTYDKSVKEAQQQPHVIVYGQDKQIDGVWLSTAWTFHHWSETRGSHGPPIGHVTIDNIKFVPRDKDAFDRPDNAREIPKPD